MAEYVAGVDGCSGGWVVVYLDVETRLIGTRIVPRIDHLLGLPSPPAVLCIDIPIGLPDHYSPGGRVCDKAARRLLGPKRGSSVFPCPARPVLGATSHKEASQLNLDETGKSVGVSIQCFNILPKILEVDALMTPELQERVIEVHPELCFYELNSQRPVIEPKKSRSGRKKRLALLESAWGRPLDDTVERVSGPGCARDDVVDAMVACWTAERILNGSAMRIPEEPGVDSTGLRMEIMR